LANIVGNKLRRDRRQAATWKETEQKILQQMKDFRRRTVVELYKATGITRPTIGKHLKIMVAIGIMRRDGSKFWLANPVEAMDEYVLKALKRMPAPSRLELIMTRGDHTLKIAPNERGRYTLYEHRDGLPTFAVEDTDRDSDMDWP
jgi:DNA-binding IclR family transcriptional regulator